MISLLGDYAYDFPLKHRLKYRLKDFLEKVVDEKYYLTDTDLERISNWNAYEKPLDNVVEVENKEKIMPTLTTHVGKDSAGMKLIKVGNYGNGHHAKDVIDSNGLSTTITTGNHGLGHTIVDGDGVLLFQSEKYGKEKIFKQISSTIKAQKVDCGVVENKYSDKSLERIKNNIVDGNNAPSITANAMQSVNHQNCVLIKEDAYTEVEKQLFTKDGHIKRYIGSEEIDEFKEGQMATTTFPNGYGHGPRTHNESIALNTIDRPSVKMNLRIRKLTPKECMRLMGFEDKDYKAMRDVGMSNSAIYHCAGDSIITTCLMAIFGQLLPISEEELNNNIKEYIERVKE